MKPPLFKIAHKTKRPIIRNSEDLKSSRRLEIEMGMWNAHSCLKFSGGTKDSFQCSTHCFKKSQFSDLPVEDSNHHLLNEHGCRLIKISLKCHTLLSLSIQNVFHDMKDYEHLRNAGTISTWVDLIVLK